MPRLFHGSELCDVDPHGHVALPDFVAETLGASPETLVVGRHEAEACLIGYGRERLAALAAQADRRRRADEDRGEDARAHHHRMRHAFGLTAPMLRTETSMHIPDAMRHLGRIDGIAFVIGAGDCFEIWRPELALASDDALLRDLAAFRLRSRKPRPNSARKAR